MANAKSNASLIRAAARSARPALFTVAFIGAVTALATCSGEAPFSTENGVAMAKMMAAMQAKPSGDADVAFVALMVPHHQGAIDMAQTELRYGRNEQLRRMAQEIIVTQQQEIAAMRLAIGHSSSAVSTDTKPLSDRSHMSMNQEP